MKHFARLALLALCAQLAACSILEGSKVQYRSAAKAPALDVPPDLTQLAGDVRYASPGGTASASAQQAQPARASGVARVAPSSVADVRVERSGNLRWLVVNRPAEQVWEPVRDFWQDSGFKLTTDDATLGLLETEWAENRAKIPQDIVRRTLGKLIDSLYSTSERDRYRTRLERRPDGGTDIFISHKGMVENYTNSQQTTTVWEPRPSDPQLEYEFLRRMLVKLGGAQAQQAEASLAAANAAPTRQAAARVARVGDAPVVQMDEGFDRAWRRVGLSLDRTGFTVEDRDRSKGTYFVRYVEPKTDDKEPGFFAKLFSGSPKASAPMKYRIVVRGEGESSTVSVLNAEGAPEASATAQRIVQVLADDLK